MNFAGYELLSFLTGRNSLLDSKLISLHVSERHDCVAVDLILSGRAGAEYEAIELRFESVIEFDFTYRSDYIFGNVEMVKLTSSDDSFYLSLDPDPSKEGPSEQDRDFVRSRNLVGKLTTLG